MAIKEIDDKEDYARALDQRVLAGIWQAGLVSDRAREAMNYKRNVIPWYNAALLKCEATKADVATLKKFVRTQRSEIDYDYFKSEILSHEQQIVALENNLPVPQMTLEQSATEQITGLVDKVDDGDTLFIGETEIRLAAIDTPEKGTPRGQEATRFLEKLVLGKEVTVFFDEHQPIELYGRVLGVIYLGDMNVNLEMVRNCIADVNTKFGRHKYIDSEEFKRVGEQCTMTFPGYGVIKFYSQPTNAEVWVDGIRSSVITPGEVDMTVGTHRITIVAPGHSPAHETIVVQPGKQELKFGLLKMPVMSGLIELCSVPDGCDFTIDDVPYGITPTIIELSSDIPHAIVMYKRGYEPKAESIVPTASRKITATITLDKSP